MQNAELRMQNYKAIKAINVGAAICRPHIIVIKNEELQYNIMMINAVQFLIL